MRQPVLAEPRGAGDLVGLAVTGGRVESDHWFSREDDKDDLAGDVNLDAQHRSTASRTVAPSGGAQGGPPSAATLGGASRPRIASARFAATG
jgi:hypothetical protein